MADVLLPITFHPECLLEVVQVLFEWDRVPLLEGVFLLVVDAHGPQFTLALQHSEHAPGDVLVLRQSLLTRLAACVAVAAVPRIGLSLALDRARSVLRDALALVSSGRAVGKAILDDGRLVEGAHDVSPMVPQFVEPILPTMRTIMPSQLTV